MAVVRPGNEERAWNDPPQFAYHQNNQTAPTKRLLNKRVPFPQSSIPVDHQSSPSVVGTLLPTSLASKADGDVSNTGVVLLPPYTTSVPPTCPTVVAQLEHINSEPVDSTCTQLQSEILSSTVDANLSDEEIHLFVISSLNTVIDSLSGKIQKRIEEDINRRITMLSSVWNENLSWHVKEKMYQLAKEISNGNYDAADTIHCSLMVDYISEVSHWMVGIKRIIHEAKLFYSKVSQKHEYEANVKDVVVPNNSVPAYVDTIQ